MEHYKVLAIQMTPDKELEALECLPVADVRGEVAPSVAVQRVRELGLKRTQVVDSSEKRADVDERRRSDKGLLGPPPTPNR